MCCKDIFSFCAFDYREPYHCYLSDICDYPALLSLVVSQQNHVRVWCPREYNGPWSSQEKYRKTDIPNYTPVSRILGYFSPVLIMVFMITNTIVSSFEYNRYFIVVGLISRICGSVFNRWLKLQPTNHATRCRDRHSKCAISKRQESVRKSN